MTEHEPFVIADRILPDGGVELTLSDRGWEMLTREAESHGCMQQEMFERILLNAINTTLPGTCVGILEMAFISMLSARVVDVS